MTDEHTPFEEAELSLQSHSKSNVKRKLVFDTPEKMKGIMANPKERATTKKKTRALTLGREVGNLLKSFRNRYDQGG